MTWVKEQHKLKERIAELEKRLQEIQGTPVAMARALFDIADELGKSPFSSDSPATYIRTRISELKEENERLKKELDLMPKGYKEL